MYDEALKRRLLDLAAGIIASDGVDQLSLRRVAAAADTSTNAIYTLFGGRDQLVEGVVAEADRSFTAAQEAVTLTGDPRVDLPALGFAYRGWALTHPSLYAVMFAGRLPATGPDCAPEDPPPSLVPLTTTVVAAHDKGLLLDDDVAGAVASIWAMIHGRVSLEIAGLAGAAPEQHVAAIGRAWLRASGAPSPDGRFR